MRTLKNDYNFCNTDEIEDVFNLLEKNVAATNKLIEHIDTLIESKCFPESIFKILTTLRNACAVNVMNIARLTK